MANQRAQAGGVAAASSSPFEVLLVFDGDRALDTLVCVRRARGGRSPRTGAAPTAETLTVAYTALVERISKPTGLAVGTADVVTLGLQAEADAEAVVHARVVPESHLVRTDAATAGASYRPPLSVARGRAVRGRSEVSERFVILGLGQARSSWFTDLARMANSGGLPLELVKCVSHEEARVRLASGRAFSALLVDGGLPGVDRDLIDAARRAGVEVLVVDDPRVSRDWDALGATDVLPPSFAVADLLASLSALTQAIPRSVAGTVLPASTPKLWSGGLIAVTGAGGTGVSTIAAALAQGLAARQGRPGAVLLADLALDADQGVLHHAPDVVPGLPELVEAHRAGSLTASEVHHGVRRREARLPPVARAPATTAAGLRCGHGVEPRSTRCSPRIRSSSPMSIPMSTATTSAGRSRSRSAMGSLAPRSLEPPPPWSSGRRRSAASTALPR